MLECGLLDRQRFANQVEARLPVFDFIAPRPRRLSGLLDQLPSSHIILADAKALADGLS
jgi:hypothetical protein